MDTSQLFELLKVWELKAELAFSSAPPDVGALMEIKNDLLRVDENLKIHVKAFVDDLTKQLFKCGIGLPGESLHDVYNKSNERTTRQVAPKRAKGFKESFKAVINCLQFELTTLKNYAFITLTSENASSYDLLLLHDRDYFVNPVKNCLQEHFSDVEVCTIDDFPKKLKSEKREPKNYICLLLFVSKMNSPPELEKCCDNVKKILEYFDSAEYISVLNTNTDDPNFFFNKTLLQHSFLNEIRYLTSTFLTNTDIPHDEEKIIKKLFKDYPDPLLEYRLLKSGNSGAKVVQIRPKKPFKNQYAKRFIVKYSPSSDDSKLKTEVNNFKKWVGAFEGFSEYTCEYDRTSTHEGILYSYAKSDYEENSFPFSKIVSDRTNQFHDSAPQLIDELFDIQVYEFWQSQLASTTNSVKEIFKDYIRTESVFEEIKKILGIETDAEFAKLDLARNCSMILDYKLKTQIKVCHGDLHTDNFFKDTKGIYLIDFGFTKELPAVIDHTFLECSIKFNHIPRYVDVETLKKLESELLDEDTFSVSHKFSRSNRNDLKYYLEIIQRIRVNSLRLLSRNDKLEYLISLFIITFKLIKYEDLNQLYAFHSATILSNKIVRMLN